MARAISHRQMELNHVNAERENLCGTRIGSLGGSGAMGGRKHAGNFYKADSWLRAMCHVEVILLRGNAVSVVNVGGEFTVKEQVVK